MWPVLMRTKATRFYLGSVHAFQNPSSKPPRSDNGVFKFSFENVLIRKGQETDKNEDIRIENTLHNMANGFRKSSVPACLERHQLGFLVAVTAEGSPSGTQEHAGGPGGQSAKKELPDPLPQFNSHPHFSPLLQRPHRSSADPRAGKGQICELIVPERGQARPRKHTASLSPRREPLLSGQVSAPTQKRVIIICMHISFPKY